jgi:hypothetical protein
VRVKLKLDTRGYTLLGPFRSILVNIPLFYFKKVKTFILSTPMKIPLRMETRSFFPMNWQINIEVLFHCIVVYEGSPHKGCYGRGYNLGVAPKRAYNREVNVGKWNVR